MTPTAESLHVRFNPAYDQIPPVRIKGFDRVKFAKLLAELGLNKGAEVGVAQGLNSLTLCQNIPEIDLLGIDPWAVYHGNPRAHPKDEQARCHALAQERLAPYRVRLVQAFSMDAARDVKDKSLDFVYIDGNHCFDYVMEDLIVWSRKVRSGGIVAGHDYYRFKWSGVVDAVDAYTRAHQINEWFIDDQRETSFFWANP